MQYKLVSNNLFLLLIMVIFLQIQKKKKGKRPLKFKRYPRYTSGFTTSSRLPPPFMRCSPRPPLLTVFSSSLNSRAKYSGGYINTPWKTSPKFRVVDRKRIYEKYIVFLLQDSRSLLCMNKSPLSSRKPSHGST